MLPCWEHSPQENLEWLLGSPIAGLIESLLESLLQSLLQILLLGRLQRLTSESCVAEGVVFPEKSFSRLNSEFVEALAYRRLMPIEAGQWHWCGQPTWLSAFGTITISVIITSTITIINITITTITIIMFNSWPNVYVRRYQNLLGSWIRIALRKLSSRSALPRIQLPTIHSESKVAIVNSLTMKHQEIVSWWPCSSQGSNYQINWYHDFGQLMLPANCHTPHATCCPLSAKHCTLLTSRLMYCGTRHRQVSNSVDLARRSIHGSILSSEFGSVLPLESILGSIRRSRLGVWRWVQLGVYRRAFSAAYFRASWELAWENTVNQAGSVPSSAIDSILESMFVCVLEKVFDAIRSVLGVCFSKSWDLSWDHTVQQAGSVASSSAVNVIESIPGSIHEMVLRCVLGSILGTDMGMSWEHTYEHLVPHARSVPSSAISRILISMPLCEPDNVLRGIHQSGLGVYVRESCKHTWEHWVKQTGSVSLSEIGRVLESMHGSVLVNTLEGVLGSILRVFLGVYYKQAGSVHSSALRMLKWWWLRSLIVFYLRGPQGKNKYESTSTAECHQLIPDSTVISGHMGHYCLRLYKSSPSPAIQDISGSGTMRHLRLHPCKTSPSLAIWAISVSGHTGHLCLRSVCAMFPLLLYTVE